MYAKNLAIFVFKLSSNEVEKCSNRETSEDCIFLFLPHIGSPLLLTSTHEVLRSHCRPPIYKVLLLQKPRKGSKPKEHSAALNRRLVLWQKGQISSFAKEGRCIQAHLSSSPRYNFTIEYNLSKKFVNLMSTEKIR